ncbi:MAG: Hsp33 family molecular chaperone HslO [Caldilinea sp.]
MENYLIRVLAKASGIRGLACLTTGIVAEVARRHQASPAGSAALGYGLTGAALLGALLKVQQHIAIKVEGDGPLGKMIVESDSYGHLRGYIAQPTIVMAPPINSNDVAAIIGQQGRLTVVKDLKVKDLYESVVPLQTGRLDTDLTYYLMMSEQAPSIVEIGAPIDARGNLSAAGGLLLQLLPDGDLALLAQMAERLDDLPPIGEMLASGETPETLLSNLFSGQDYEVLETYALQFRCTCSRNRSRQAIKLLGRNEIEELLAEGEAIVDCHFCHEHYLFDRSDLQTILDEIAAGD